MKILMNSNYIKYLAFSLAIIIFGTLLGYHQLSPTRVPNNYEEKIISLSDVTSDKADYSMVMSHVYHMSKEAHPSGSDAIKKVQNYLTEQFEAIGCNYQTLNFEVNTAPIIEEKLAEFEDYMKEHPEEQEPFDQYLRSLGFTSYEEKLKDDFNCTDNAILPLTNYLVTLDAPDTEEGVLFVSHYDSTSGGPGASDDLISVGAILEALRQASNNKSRKNDLYFLFTDGEELDLFGAENYVNSQSSDQDKIKLVINLEARGTSGPLIMFETSLQNKNIIKELNKALDHNLMLSFAVAVYRMMPNNTDLTSFLKKGYSGINFAMIGNPENYHARTDTFHNLNRDSAYMYYETTVILTDYFSTSDLASLSCTEDAVYFPFLKSNTIVLSNHWMLLFSYITGALSILWIGFLFFKGVIKIKHFIVSLSVSLISFVPSVILGILCNYIYNRIAYGREFLQAAASLNILFYAFYIVCVLITVVFIGLIIKRIKTQAMFAGILLLFTLTNIACTILLNGLAYIFTIPLGFLLMFSIILYLSKHKSAFLLPAYLYAALYGIILCLLYIPVIDLIYTALLNDAILAVFLITSLGILPIAALSKCVTYHKKANEVQG